MATPWNGEASLSREWVQGKKIGEETTIVHWEFFLDQLLPSDGPLRQLFAKENDIKSAISLQEDFETLLYFANSHDGKKVLEALFSQELEALRTSDKAAGPMKHLEASLGPLAPLDRLYALDLYRLAICSPRFSDPLLAKIGTMKLATYRSLEQAFCRFEKAVKKEAFEKFHREDFTKWREEHQKAFLLEKRKKEKENKIYVHPYLDYLDQKEKERFSYFWEEHRYEILQQHLKTHPEGEPLERVIAHFPEELVLEFLRTFRPFDELDRPLFFNPEQTEKDLAASFYPKGGYGFSRSYAYQTAAPLGSLFKLIGSYEGLRQGHSLQIIDEYNPEIPSNKQPVAYSPSRVPYPRQYKGGRLPRSSSSQIGKIDLIGAIEHSSNPFFSLLAGDFFSHPEDLNRAAHLFGLGEKTDIALPGETAGSLPTDLATHKTGLYSYAIGQHTLLATPLQSALMLSTFVNGGSLLRPKIIRTLSGFEASRDPFSQENRFAKKELEAVGIPYPLFTAIQSRTPHLAKTEPASEVRWKVSIPPSIKFPILEGMHRSLWSGKGNARPPSIRTLLGNPAWMRDFLSLENQMIGKTSTAEIKINPNLNPSSRAQMYKHIWFGAASFDAPPSAPAKIRWDHPELVVLVFLRYGDAGREAAPLAAEMIVKWREIKKKHMSGS